jgi:hypothetical protein
VVRLRSTIDRTRLVSVRSIANSVLNDQVQQLRKIRGDLPWHIQMFRLKSANGLACPIEAQLARLYVPTSRSLSHHASNQVVDQKMYSDLFRHYVGRLVTFDL